MDQIDETGDQEAETAAVNDESSVGTSITTISESQNCFVTNNDDGMNNVDLTAPVSCTACHHQINIKKPGSVHKHPVLEVLLCRTCFKWYNSGSIDQGSDGMDEQCRWCGQGGKLVLCDFCHNAFCKDCVRKNLGRQELSTITAENAKWHCYVCNPAPLKDLVASCTRLQDALKRCDGEILQSANLTSDTDSESSCSQGARADGECFFTNANVDSLADELYCESRAWVKKLETLRNGLKNRGSSRGRQSRDDLAQKIYQHYKGLENCLSRIKVKGLTVKDAERKNVTKLKRGRSKKENDIQVLDISLSGSDVELDSKDRNGNKLKEEKRLSEEESQLNCDGSINCNNAKDTGDIVVQSAEGMTDLQGVVAENHTCTVDGGSSENMRIRLKISLPKVNTADLEAQRQLHLEGLKARDRSDSEDEEDDDTKPKAGHRNKARMATKARKTNSENNSSEKEEDEEEEEEEEETKSSTSSEEEYNPKNDLRDMKSEMRHQRREQLQKMKTKAAKRSLKKIRETIQQKKARSKEVLDDDVDDDDGETAKEETKDEKKENKRNSPTKRNANNGSPRKSERSTKVVKTKEEEKEEEEGEGKEAKGAKESKKKSKPNAKASGKAMSENKDVSNDEGDAVKESGKAEGKNKKKQRVGHKSTSDGEASAKCDKDEDADTKVRKKENSKKLRSVNAKKEDAVAAAGDGDRKGSEFDVLDEEIKRLEKMPKSNSRPAAVSKLEERMDTNEARDEESEEKKTENKKEGSCVDGLLSEDETRVVENEVEEKECENKKKETRIVELFSVESDDMEEKESDQSSEENGIAEDGPIELDNYDDENDDAKARKALVDDSDEEEISSGNETEIGDDDDDEDDEDEPMTKKGRKKANGSNRACELDGSESEADGKVKKKRSKINLPNISVSDSEEDFESKKTRGKKKKRKTAEDSANETDEDCVITKKRGRRKRKNSSSKSESSDSDSSSKKKKKKRKRRRIKSSSSTENEDESAEGSADELQSSQGKKRKKIHKILGDKKLSRQTLNAAKAEEERRQRILERQKLFNKIAAEVVDSPTECPIATKLILELNEETEEPIIEVHKKLIPKLKPHQVEAVQFMWNCCVETLERLKTEEGSGCILAHCMGLGKTLSVITFVHTLLRHKKLTKMKTCLVLCPLNTILNWESEFDRWLTDITSLDVYELSTVKDNWGRSEVVKNWQEGGGVLIMGYDMFRTLSQLSRVKNKKQKKVFTEGLLNPGPDIVVCDEGHILKNDVTGLSKACNQIKTKRRVVLTGTPLQNNLIEYHCMVNFVKPNLLGTRKEFSNRFVNPMTNGQCSDSTLHDVKIMKRRAHILHETLAGCVQRKDYSALTKYLLPKHEYVVLIRLSKVQIELYEKYLQKLGEDLSTQTVRGSRIFTDYQNLMKIWTHPWVLKLDEIRQETKKIYKDDEDSFIDDSDGESEMSFNSKSSKSGGEADLAEEDDWRPKRVTRGAAKKQKEETAKEKATPANDAKDKQANDEKEEEIVKGWKTRSRGGGPAVENEEPADNSDGDGSRVSSEWWADYLKPSDQFNLEISGKLMLLAEILKMSESIGDKVLVFSQSLLSLDLIENFLAHWDKMVAGDSDKQVAGAQGWDKGIDYIRMDGSTSAQNRKEWTAMFNDEENVKARLFLISTKAGSLGINLVAANRVIIFDASWNPTHDVQSIFRVYRFGQTKPVYVYRFVAQGTMEEKVYERQVTKQSLSQRVIDEHQIERHFTAADLKELYVFKPDRIDDPNRPERPTPKLPKDRMLAELLTNHKDLIVQYHEHDSLLENKVEEELSEEERKTAWEEYEQEKKGLRPPPASYQYNNMAAAAMMQSLYNQPSTFPMSSYIPDAHKIAQAIYASNPGISEVELKQRVQYYLQMQLVNQQRAFLAQQQKQEAEKLQRMQEERYRQQMLIAQQLGYGSSRSDASGGATAAEMSLTPNLLTALTSSQSVQPSKTKGSGGQSSSK